MSQEEYSDSDLQFYQDDLVIDEEDDLDDDEYNEDNDEVTYQNKIHEYCIKNLTLIRYKPTKYLQYINNNLITPSFSFTFTPISKFKIIENLQPKYNISQLSLKTTSLLHQKDVKTLIEKSGTSLANVNIILINQIPKDIIIPSNDDISKYINQ